MALADCKPTEMVLLHGIGEMQLRTAVLQVMAKPPSRRQLVSIYRAKGKDPSILDIGDIEQLARRSDFQPDPA